MAGSHSLCRRRLSIGHGCDINWKDRYGESPLLVAAIHQHVDVLNKLLEAGGLQKSDTEHLIAEVLADAAGSIKKRQKEQETQQPPPPIQVTQTIRKCST